MVPPGLLERQAALVNRLAGISHADGPSTLRPRPFILHRLGCAADERIMGGCLMAGRARWAPSEAGTRAPARYNRPHERP